MGPIIDTHVHVWDPGAVDYGWLTGEFDRPYLPADIPRRPADDVAMVFMEAGARDGLQEAEWVAGLDWPERVAIVAQADLSRGDAIAGRLDELAALDGVVGIRWNLEDQPATVFESPDLVAGLRRLAERELTFDACVREHQLAALTSLIAQVPELLVVLDHLGKPDASREPGRQWLTNLLQLSGLPNVSMKLSGVPPEADSGRDLEPQAGPVIEAAVDAFGVARCMLGSDWPVSTATPQRVTPGEWFDLVFSSLGASEDEQAQLGWRTASEFYGIAAGGA